MITPAIITLLFSIQLPDFPSHMESSNLSLDGEPSWQIQGEGFPCQGRPEIRVFSQSRLMLQPFLDQDHQMGDSTDILGVEPGKVFGIEFRRQKAQIEGAQTQWIAQTSHLGSPQATISPTLPAFAKNESHESLDLALEIPELESGEEIEIVATSGQPGIVGSLCVSNPVSIVVLASPRGEFQG